VGLVEAKPMKPLLWYVVAVHLLASAFFAWRFWLRFQKRRHGYRITGLMAYLALGPAFGAARELHWVRMNVGAALAFVSAFLGTLLLFAIYEAHFRGE
jgi:hypothetical protein